MPHLDRSALFVLSGTSRAKRKEHTMTNSVASPIEAHLLQQLGGTPWRTEDFTPDLHAKALTRLLAVSRAAGFKGAVSWMTTPKDNLKFAKSVAETVGVTLLAARSAADAWAGLPSDQRQALAAALSKKEDDIDKALRHTVCPRSTPCCRFGCVVNTSAKAKLRRNTMVRLVRTLVTVCHPSDACVMTFAELSKLAKRHGYEGGRWRVNVADDIRWENLAPGLFGHIKAYTYTKYTPEHRPEIEGLRIVYSASERWTTCDIANRLAQGHTVAVVLDVKRGELPNTWQDHPVSDGDATDDLWEHQHGAVVGLTAKGTNNVKEVMRTGGFSRAV